MAHNDSLPVAIIGGGPVGLAAAAHLTLMNQPFLLFEAGNSVGANVLSWAHVRIFSPWRYNIDKAARELLNGTGWTGPDENELPTGAAIYHNYLKPLAELPSIRPFVLSGTKVIAVGRRNMDKMKTWGRNEHPFVIQVDHRGAFRQYEAKAVIDTSGTWHSPNPLGSGGNYALGEIENADKIFYGIPDIGGVHAARYQNKSVLVVGSGHSSINAVIALENLKQKFPETEIHWAMRKKNLQDVYGGGSNDALEARGALGAAIRDLVEDDHVNVYTPFQIQEILTRENKLTVVGLQDGQRVALPPVDQIISNTGARPDFSFLREVRLKIDPSLECAEAIAELIDPNVHSCGTVRPHGEKDLRHADENFYIAGAKSYGRAPTFLMATGYEQVRSIVAAIDGDLEAARNVELDLPETGVCGTDGAGGACCGASPVSEKKTAAAVRC